MRESPNWVRRQDEGDAQATSTPARGTENLSTELRGQVVSRRPPVRGDSPLALGDRAGSLPRRPCPGGRWGRRRGVCGVGDRRPRHASSIDGDGVWVHLSFRPQRYVVCGPATRAHALLLRLWGGGRPVTGENRTATGRQAGGHPCSCPGVDLGYPCAAGRVRSGAAPVTPRCSRSVGDVSTRDAAGRGPRPA